jgi:hypothetical protein
LALLGEDSLCNGECLPCDGQAGDDREVEEDFSEFWLGDAVGGCISDASCKLGLSSDCGARSQGYQAPGVRVQAGMCQHVGKPIALHQLFELG